ncbi:MAG: hypothetical protein AB7O62_20525 [Pirellulales bacterium]
MTDADTPDTADDDLELDVPAVPAPDSEAVPAAKPRRNILGPLRWLLRGTLLLICVALLAVGWWGRRPGGHSTADQDWGVVVTLDEGPAYGEAIIYVGDPASGKNVSDDVELQLALQTALASASSTRVLVQAAPGVNMGSIERVQTALRALKTGQPVEITLGLYEPAAAENK